MIALAFLFSSFTSCFLRRYCYCILRCYCSSLLRCYCSSPVRCYCYFSCAVTWRSRIQAPNPKPTYHAVGKKSDKKENLPGFYLGMNILCRDYIHTHIYIYMWAISLRSLLTPRNNSDIRSTTASTACTMILVLFVWGLGIRAYLQEPKE